MSNHYPSDLDKLAEDRSFDQLSYWHQYLTENPQYRGMEQVAFQTTENKTVYIIRPTGKSGKSFHVTPDVVFMFKNDPDAIHRELNRLTSLNCLPVMPTQAHPTSKRTLALAYDNERIIEAGGEKKWEFRQYQVGRWMYHGIGYETGKDFLIISDDKVFQTVDMTRAIRQ